MLLSLLTAGVIVPARGEDSLAAAMRELRDKEAALTLNQRNMRDSLGNIVRQEMMTHVGDTRDDSDTASVQRFRLQVSLITCGAGPEIYEYYGHSAIRILRTDSLGLDVVFNYGVFDFNSGNFALRFALGHTDYVCAMQPTADFLDRYRRNGIFVEEQVLNLTQAEAHRLFDALLLNSQPENCVYRYNFFYDNCATRVRDKIEECLDATLRYPERPTERSMRQAVHYFSHNHRWATFGQDLLLGSEADIPATGRELQFAPIIMQQDFAQTLIVDNTGIVRMFAGEKQRLVDLPPIQVRPSVFLSPLAVMLYLLIGVLVIGVWEWRKVRILWPLDSVLLLLQGLGGVLVTFLYFFSTHPTVGSNWLVWVLNPLPLVGLYWQIKGGLSKRYWYYHAVALTVLALFMLSLPVIPQYISLAAILMLTSLLVRSLTNVIVFLKIRKKHES